MFTMRLHLWTFLLLSQLAAILAKHPIRLVAYPHSLSVERPKNVLSTNTACTVENHLSMNNSIPCQIPVDEYEYDLGEFYVGTVHRDRSNKNTFLVRVSEPHLKQGLFLKPHHSLIDDVILIPFDSISKRTRKKLEHGVTAREFKKLDLDIIVRDGVGGLMAGIGSPAYTIREKQIYDAHVDLSEYIIEKMKPFDEGGELYEVILHLLQGKDIFGDPSSTLFKRSVYYLVPNFLLQRTENDTLKMELKTVVETTPFDEVKQFFWTHLMYKYIPYFRRMFEKGKEIFVKDIERFRAYFQKAKVSTGANAPNLSDIEKYRKILQIQKGQESDWEKAYRRAAFKHHPDRFKAKSEEERLQNEKTIRAINEAKTFFRRYEESKRE